MATRFGVLFAGIGVLRRRADAMSTGVIIMFCCSCESTSAPWVILVINVNISLVGLIPLPSVFQMSSTMAWQGQEDVEPLQNAKDKRIGSSSKHKTLHFLFL